MNVHSELIANRNASDERNDESNNEHPISPNNSSSCLNVVHGSVCLLPHRIIAPTNFPIILGVCMAFKILQREVSTCLDNFTRYSFTHLASAHVSS